MLEEGSVGSHAAIVARALAIPLVIQAARITREAMNGDPILVDGDLGHVHLRPEETVAKAFREKVDMLHEAQAAYAALRDKPATTRDGVTLQLHMNAGLMADLPSLPKCGAVGVGLFRTELQFLVRSSVPKRPSSPRSTPHPRRGARQARRLPHPRHRLGQGAALHEARRRANPALGWRAIRVGLDRPGMMRMQVQALIRGAGAGRCGSCSLRHRVPRVRGRAGAAAERGRARERARALAAARAQDRSDARDAEPRLCPRPFLRADRLRLGRRNDLKQFFAADRENELVRRRYDMLSLSFLDFLEHIVGRCAESGTPLSYCGEDAVSDRGLALAAIGFRNLSMRPASIGPKALLRQVDPAARVPSSTRPATPARQASGRR